jgi:transposase-like protein
MERGLYLCQGCRYQSSVTAGTIFAGTRKPLRQWFLAIWHVTNQKQGVSALGLQRALGLGSYRTAWTWMHKLRLAMVRPGRDRLSGRVQIDETYVGGVHAGDPGRAAAGKSLVLVAVEEASDDRIGRIRLMQIADASMSTLHQAIEQTVKPNSLVCTDGWRGYNHLDVVGYNHEVVRSDSDVGEQLLPLAHRVASLLKSWLLGTHQGGVRPSHLDYYLDEFTFCFNRRTSRSRGKLFYRLVQQAVAMNHTPGAKILHRSAFE